MKGKNVLNNLTKIFAVILLLSVIFYLWLSMFHLKLNPDVFKQEKCDYSYSLEAYIKARQILNKQQGEFVSTREMDAINSQLSPREYHCSRESVFKRTK